MNTPRDAPPATLRSFFASTSGRAASSNSVAEQHQPHRPTLQFTADVSRRPRPHLPRQARRACDREAGRSSSARATWSTAAPLHPDARAGDPASGKRSKLCTVAVCDCASPCSPTRWSASASRRRPPPPPEPRQGGRQAAVAAGRAPPPRVAARSAGWPRRARRCRRRPTRRRGSATCRRSAHISSTAMGALGDPNAAQQEGGAAAIVGAPAALRLDPPLFGRRSLLGAAAPPPLARRRSSRSPSARRPRGHPDSAELLPRLHFDHGLAIDAPPPSKALERAAPVPRRRRHDGA